MSEPCEHQKHEAAWIWAQQLRFVTDERDAALDRLKRVEWLLSDEAQMGCYPYGDGQRYLSARSLHAALDSEP